MKKRKEVNKPRGICKEIKDRIKRNKKREMKTDGCQ
jgi:hypothetical protein